MPSVQLFSQRGPSTRSRSITAEVSIMPRGRRVSSTWTVVLIEYGVDVVSNRLEAI